MAIIGAGASGVLVAAHVRRAAPSLRVAIVDAGARAARGLAYGTPYGAHLLNVPAGRMSAFVDDPDHFTRWLGAPPSVFAPRSRYGEYLAQVLDESGAEKILGSAVGLTPSWNVHLHDGRVLAARTVVLALGNLAPADPLKLGDAAPPNYLRDPWAPGAAQGLAPDAEILIIGTGLTMIDLVLALRAEGHRGVVHAISRRGLVPHAHAPAKQPPAPRPLPPAPSPLAMLRWIREQSEHGDWRAVIDALRPHTTKIWQSWTLAQRDSFLRHARVFWDVHRHRAAPEVAAEVEKLRRQGILNIHAGRVIAIHENGDVVTDKRTFHVARVINCTGPASDYATLDLPLVAQLRRAGWLVPDPLRLGIETDADGRLAPGLFTIGPLRRPALWESTAIPEIREQAAALAKVVLAS